MESELSPGDEQKKQAMITALRSLAAGDKSENDLLQKLKQKGFGEASITATLDQLKREGLLSDEVYAEKLARRILQDKRGGAHKLAFELKKRRVPEAIRKTVLDAIDPAQQRQQALEIAELKLSSFKNSSGRVLAKKLYDFLMRKGYDFQLAQDVARIVAMKSGRHLDHENS